MNDHEEEIRVSSFGENKCDVGESLPETILESEPLEGRSIVRGRASSCECKLVANG